MKILIIGSKGFLGSAGYKYFSEKHGYEVFGADVVTEYDDPNYFLIDATNADFKSIFKDYQFDYCINCAGAASVPDSFIHPERDYLLNVYLLVNLLNAIKELNPGCKLIQLSSAAVYGNPQSLPIKEEHMLKPLSPYGIHKKQAEELCRLYHDYFGLSVTVFRVFSAYGKGLKKQLFWDIYKKSQLNKQILLFGTGLESREFIHINDIINAMEIVLNAEWPGFRILNIANNQPEKIEKAALMLLKYLHFPGELRFSGTVRNGDPLNWQADISKLLALGYNNSVTFENGINDYCKWLKEKE